MIMQKQKLLVTDMKVYKKIKQICTTFTFARITLK